MFLKTNKMEIFMQEKAWEEYVAIETKSDEKEMDGGEKGEERKIGRMKRRYIEKERGERDGERKGEEGGRGRRGKERESLEGPSPHPQLGPTLRTVTKSWCTSWEPLEKDFARMKRVLVCSP